MALLVITVPSDLSEDELALAAEVGPPLAASDAPLTELVRWAGFTQIVERDRTEAFRETCEGLLRERAALETELRKADGDEVFDQEVEKKERLLAGIREGLLQRKLLVATASEPTVG